MDVLISIISSGSGHGHDVRKKLRLYEVLENDLFYQSVSIILCLGILEKKKIRKKNKMKCI